MFWNRKETEEPVDCATREDFCRLFEADMKPLYLLAFLLTANHAHAEQCFVAGIDDAAQGNTVFKQWARSWARRTVIKNAIRVVAPASQSSQGHGEMWDGTEESSVALTINTISQLEPLPRFVFVMSVLERYSDRECSLLLGCTTGDVVEARNCALQGLAAIAPPPAGSLTAGHQRNQLFRPLPQPMTA